MAHFRNRDTPIYYRDHDDYTYAHIRPPRDSRPFSHSYRDSYIRPRHVTDDLSSSDRIIVTEPRPRSSDTLTNRILSAMLSRSPSPTIRSRTVSVSRSPSPHLSPYSYSDRERDGYYGRYDDVDRDRDSGRRFAMCRGCYKPGRVCSSGYCAECDFYTPPSMSSGMSSGRGSVPLRRAIATGYGNGRDGGSYYDDGYGSGGDYVVRRFRTVTRSPELVSSSSGSFDRDADWEIVRDREMLRPRERAWEREERRKGYDGYYASDSDGFA